MLFAVAGSLALVATKAIKANCPVLGNRENMSLWYQPVTISSPLPNLGCPRTITYFNNINDLAAEKTAVKRLRDATEGAEVYRYVQMYYLPENRPMMGIDIGNNLDMAFCKSGNTPSYDTAIKTGPVHWYFLDNNEQEVYNATRAYFKQVKQAGYRGIFLDLGRIAMNDNFWAKKSTCTQQPVVASNTSADAYAKIITLAKSMGLKVIANIGAPDGIIKVRPDPRDSDCVNSKWASCNTLNDVVDSADYILDEGTSNKADDSTWLNSMVTLTREEHFTRGSAKVIALGAYRGPADELVNRHIQYQWGIMKLFPVHAAFGAGIDRCGETATQPMPADCNRGGIVPPELINTQLGTSPLDPAPLKYACDADGWHCIYARRYYKGLVLVNNSSSQKVSGTVRFFDDGSCRYTSVQPSGNEVAGKTCVTGLNRSLPPFSAEIFIYSKTL